MRYGNFVGQGNIPFTEEEKQMLLEHFKEQMSSVFDMGMFKKPYVSNYKNDDNYVIVEFDFKNPFVGRNLYKDRIRCSGIYFFVNKSAKGWLEITDKKNPYKFPKERDYENCPEFQYGCRLCASGIQIGYRKRNKESIQNWQPYTYGTEISDLDYKNEMYKVRDTLTEIK